MDVQRSRYAGKGPENGANPMLSILGVVSALVAVVLLPRMLVPGDANPDLGWMSQQWLSEYRASHSA